MKIPFEIKFRPQIESGEYKVETRDGKRARIICWDLKGNEDFFIMALVEKNGREVSYCYPATGCCKAALDPDGKDDLFLITPEPELGEFENKLRVICEDAVRESQLFPERTSEDFAKKHSAELLELARKELEPEVLERLEAAYKNQDEVVYENGKRDGKAEALKDLPRWIDDGMPKGSGAIDISGLCGFDFIRRNGKLLRISDLEKLPGFNE